jgi:hypothetical protein
VIARQSARGTPTTIAATRPSASNGSTIGRSNKRQGKRPGLRAHTWMKTIPLPASQANTSLSLSYCAFI